MIKFTYDQLSVRKIKDASGIFIGKTNTISQFSNKSIINEVAGTISGNENKILHNQWIKNKENREEE